MHIRTAVLVTAVAALTAVLTGCGSDSGDPTSYGMEKRTLTVDAGDAFSLDVPLRCPMGDNWYLADPAPDTAVLKEMGTRRACGDDGEDGSNHFDFTARAKGTATVTLLHCPNGMCHSAREAATASPSASGAPLYGDEPTQAPTATATPDERVTYYQYRITVR
ncbi:hypothetical protein [Streptomyces sp. VRA16 Mangrove soil]|uniref:hypothetical protein n=1 Tax=Streptomyces sp. VRA16 Mangrove soil TaxID=2817434 RepID=UPI001A9D2522|nr:hypothetical protein [Streptomyces sp. VRA16 Mangrove soil]MBO1334661.1 hypothetical protein [Streptomyces sp. VRA16 Mangrove soil]